MNLQEKLDMITSKLDEIWSRYENVPGFAHPVYPERGPEKQQWPDLYPGGEEYFWRFLFDVGDGLDTDSCILRYNPESELFNIMFGNTSNGANETSPDFKKMLSLFELCIVEEVIGSRPKK